MNLVITGSIAYDYIMSFPGNFLEHVKPDKLQKLSLSFLVDVMRRQYGGCAANIAYNLALLGERPILMGTAGQDFCDYRLWLEEHGVDTSSVVEIPEKFTASFFVNTDLVQNQIASFYTGAMANARDLSFRDLSFKTDLTIISPNDPVAMEKYPQECRELSIPFIYDPSQQIVRMNGETLREGVRGADILIVNDYEFELFKECTGMSAEEIRAAVKRAVIITRGEEGSTIWADTQIDIPCVPATQVADPTGVGDAYRAGIIKGLAMGLPWEACGRLGSVVATYVLELPGPQTHSYTLQELVARYRANFGEDAFTEAVEE